MRKAIIFCFVLAISQSLFAQIDPAKQARLEKRDRPAQDMFLNLGLGSQGVVGEVGRFLSDRAAIRAGVGFLPLKFNSVKTFSQVEGDVEFKTENFMNIHVILDYKPFPSFPLMITPGIGYFNDATASAKVSPKGTYKYGDISVDKDIIGDMTGTVTWDGVAPYLGVAYSFSKEVVKPLNFGIYLGSYYLPKPTTTFAGTRLLENNEYNAQKFQENMETYRALPVLQLNITYRFIHNKETNLSGYF